MRARFLPQLVIGVLGFSICMAWADDPAVPGEGFGASRYEALWTKSPFAVATAEAAPESSDYSLVGIAQFDGVSYASLIDKQNNQEHFLLSSDKPSKGITLVSVTRGHGPSDTLAVIQKAGQSITLKLEQPALAPAAAANGAPGMPPNAAGLTPGVITPQIPMPGASAPGNPGQMSPPVRIRPRIISVPPPPGQQPQFQQAPPPSQ